MSAAPASTPAATSPSAADRAERASYSAGTSSPRNSRAPSMASWAWASRKAAYSASTRAGEGWPQVSGRTTHTVRLTSPVRASICPRPRASRPPWSALSPTRYLTGACLS